MAKKQDLKKSLKLTISSDTVLNTELICNILEATGRFEFILENEFLDTISFWDNHWEQEYSIGRNYTLSQLMQWLTNFYAKDYEQRGISKAQSDFRNALGL